MIAHIYDTGDGPERWMVYLSDDRNRNREGPFTGHTMALGKGRRGLQSVTVTWTRFNGEDISVKLSSSIRTVRRYVRRHREPRRPRAGTNPFHHPTGDTAMGDRCIIYNRDSGAGIYLQSMGHPDYVQAAIEVAKEENVRMDDPEYMMARLAQILAGYIDARRTPEDRGDQFSERLGIGILGTPETPNPDGLDEGVYIVDEGGIVSNITTSGERDWQAMLNRVWIGEIKHEMKRMLPGTVEYGQ